MVAQEYLSEQHVRIRVGRAGSTTSNIMQKIIRVDRNDRRRMLIDLLTEFPGVRTIIFVNAVQEVDNLDDFLFNQGLPVTSTHSGRSQKEREAALRAFRSGKEPILVASGVAGRGIDVRNVAHVINYDLPTIDHGGIEDYTHRIGKSLLVYYLSPLIYQQAELDALATVVSQPPSSRSVMRSLAASSRVLSSRPTRRFQTSSITILRKA